MLAFDVSGTYVKPYSLPVCFTYDSFVAGCELQPSLASFRRRHLTNPTHPHMSSKQRTVKLATATITYMDNFPLAVAGSGGGGTIVKLVLFIAVDELWLMDVVVNVVVLPESVSTGVASKVTRGVVVLAVVVVAVVLRGKTVVGTTTGHGRVAQPTTQKEFP